MIMMIMMMRRAFCVEIDIWEIKILLKKVPIQSDRWALGPPTKKKNKKNLLQNKQPVALRRRDMAKTKQTAFDIISNERPLLSLCVVFYYVCIYLFILYFDLLSPRYKYALLLLLPITYGRVKSSSTYKQHDTSSL